MSVWMTKHIIGVRLPTLSVIGPGCPRLFYKVKDHKSCTMLSRQYYTKLDCVGSTAITCILVNVKMYYLVFSQMEIIIMLKTTVSWSS